MTLKMPKVMVGSPNLEQSSKVTKSCGSVRRAPVGVSQEGSVRRVRAKNVPKVNKAIDTGENARVRRQRVEPRKNIGTAAESPGQGSFPPDVGIKAQGLQAGEEGREEGTAQVPEDDRHSPDGALNEESDQEGSSASTVKVGQLSDTEGGKQGPLTDTEGGKQEPLTDTEGGKEGPLTDTEGGKQGPLTDTKGGKQGREGEDQKQGSGKSVAEDDVSVENQESQNRTSLGKETDEYQSSGASIPATEENQASQTTKQDQIERGISTPKAKEVHRKVSRVDSVVQTLCVVSSEEEDDTRCSMLVQCDQASERPAVDVICEEGFLSDDGGIIEGTYDSDFEASDLPVDEECGSLAFDRVSSTHGCLDEDILIAVSTNCKPTPNPPGLHSEGEAETDDVQGSTNTQHDKGNHGQSSADDKLNGVGEEQQSCVESKGRVSWDERQSIACTNGSHVENENQDGKGEDMKMEQMSNDNKQGDQRGEQLTANGTPISGDQSPRGSKQNENEDNEPLSGDIKENNESLSGDTKENNEPLSGDNKENNEPLSGDDKDNRQPLSGDAKENSESLSQDPKENSEPSPRDTKENSGTLSENNRESSESLAGDTKDNSKPLSGDIKENNESLSGNTKDNNESLSGKPKENNESSGDTKKSNEPLSGDSEVPLSEDTKGNKESSLGNAKENNESLSGDPKENEESLGDSKESSRPLSGDTKEKVSLSGDTEVNESLSRDTKENSEPLSGDVKKNNKSLSADTTENNESLPGDNRENNGALSGGTKENKESSLGDTKENNQPLSGDTKENNQPLSGDTKENNQPLSGDTKENSQPLSGDTKENNQPLSGDTKESSQPLSGDTKENNQPLSGDTKENNQPLSGDNKENNQPLSGDTKGNHLIGDEPPSCEGKDHKTGDTDTVQQCGGQDDRHRTENKPSGVLDFKHTTGGITCEEQPCGSELKAQGVGQVPVSTKPCEGGKEDQPVGNTYHSSVDRQASSDTGPDKITDRDQMSVAGEQSSQNTEHDEIHGEKQSAYDSKQGKADIDGVSSGDAKQDKVQDDQLPRDSKEVKDRDEEQESSKTEEQDKKDENPPTADIQPKKSTCDPVGDVVQEALKEQESESPRSGACSESASHLKDDVHENTRERNLSSHNDIHTAEAVKEENPPSSDPVASEKTDLKDITRKSPAPCGTRRGSTQESNKLDINEEHVSEDEGTSNLAKNIIEVESTDDNCTTESEASNPNADSGIDEPMVSEVGIHVDSENQQESGSHADGDQIVNQAEKQSSEVLIKPGELVAVQLHSAEPELDVVPQDSAVGIAEEKTEVSVKDSDNPTSQGPVDGGNLLSIHEAHLQRVHSVISGEASEEDHMLSESDTAAPSSSEGEEFHGRRKPGMKSGPAEQQVHTVTTTASKMKMSANEMSVATDNEAATNQMTSDCINKSSTTDLDKGSAKNMDSVADNQDCASSDNKLSTGVESSRSIEATLVTAGSILPESADIQSAGSSAKPPAGTEDLPPAKEEVVESADPAGGAASNSETEDLDLLEDAELALDEELPTMDEDSCRSPTTLPYATPDIPIDDGGISLTSTSVPDEADSSLNFTASGTLHQHSSASLLEKASGEAKELSDSQCQTASHLDEVKTGMKQEPSGEYSPATHGQQEHHSDNHEGGNVDEDVRGKGSQGEMELLDNDTLIRAGGVESDNLPSSTHHATPNKPAPLPGPHVPRPPSTPSSGKQRGRHRQHHAHTPSSQPHTSPDPSPASQPDNGGLPDGHLLPHPPSSPCSGPVRKRSPHQCNGHIPNQGSLSPTTTSTAKHTASDSELTTHSNSESTKSTHKDSKENIPETNSPEFPAEDMDDTPERSPYRTQRMEEVWDVDVSGCVEVRPAVWSIVCGAVYNYCLHAVSAGPVWHIEAHTKWELCCGWHF